MVAFYLNDQPICTAEPPAGTLLGFVRYHEHLKGAKIACAKAKPRPCCYLGVMGSVAKVAEPCRGCGKRVL